MVDGVLHQVKALSELGFELNVHHKHREQSGHVSSGGLRNTNLLTIIHIAGNQAYERCLNDKRVEGSFRSFTAVSVVKSHLVIRIDVIGSEIKAVRTHGHF